MFAGLAQEAVATCSETVHFGRRMVQRRSSSMDGMLFLVKHLLILREQIAPFNTEFSSVQKQLDFTHMREHLRRIVRGETSLLTFGASNAFLSLVSQVRRRERERRRERDGQVDRRVEGRRQGQQRETHTDA